LRAEVSRGSRSSDRERGCETGRRWFAGPGRNDHAATGVADVPRHSPVDDVVVQVQELLTPAAHHWQASLRLVVQLGGDRYFLLLSYADGSAAIHRAIDEKGTVGGDWWGSVHAPSLEDCLGQFAAEQGASLESLCAAIRSSAPDHVALTQSPGPSTEKPEGDHFSSAERRDGEDSR
jgi:hypothetical protein